MAQLKERLSAGTGPWHQASSAGARVALVCEEERITRGMWARKLPVEKEHI